MGNLIIKKGNIFESQVQTLVNSVNCEGIMGKGIALEFKKRFPEMFRDYEDKCKKGLVRLGQPYLFKQITPPWILNFPTKKRWRSLSRIQDIEDGLIYLRDHYREWGITSLAVPALGCSNGKLDWCVVGPLLYKYLSQLDIPVEIYAPLDANEAELDIEFLRGLKPPSPSARCRKLKPEWLVLAEILARVEHEPYRAPVGRIFFQKIAYFATAEGIPTGLRFVRGSYGPYSPDLKALQSVLLNHGIIEEVSKEGRIFLVKVGKTFNMIKEAYREELDYWNPQVERISDLILRFKSSRAVEIAATIHFVAYNLKNALGRLPSEMEVFKGVREWKIKRKPSFSDEEIRRFVRIMNALEWIDVDHSKEQLHFVEDEIP
ncbi:MAG: macro domain-containing protein [candidate division WOR-3 bacterium]